MLMPISTLGSSKHERERERDGSIKRREMERKKWSEQMCVSAHEREREEGGER